MSDIIDSTSFRCGRIGIVGRPNVGKSTLMNALVGQKISITSRKAETTRHCITGINTFKDAQFLFIDTPGLQTNYKTALNRTMNRAVTSTLASIDVILFVIEAIRFCQADKQALNLIPINIPTLLIANKIDRINDKKVLYPFIKKISMLHKFIEVVPISAKRRDDIDYLLKIVKTYLPEGEQIYSEDDLTDRSLRFLAAEILREKIFRWTGNEIPYTSTVIIEKFNNKKQSRYILATIIVNHNNHKAIVIGKNGNKLKQISTEARIDMERLFKVPVYLETFLKVKSGWANSEGRLLDYGYK
ncbi:MAG: GTPase Era [Burkholderia sp.]|nr:GTPase Era [Burkholderia sp.]